jgi:hypothetical protein
MFGRTWGLATPSAVLSDGADGMEKRVELVVGENWSVEDADEPERPESLGCGCGSVISGCRWVTRSCPTTAISQEMLGIDKLAHDSPRNHHRAAGRTDHPRRSLTMNLPGPSPAAIQTHLYSSFLEAKTADVTLHVRGTWEAIYRLHRVVLIQAVCLLAFLLED